MSHDFVEAALLGRAGYALWLAYDLPGSCEETPSSLLEEMQRDRRWCQGNLQHLRLLSIEGLFGAHRALFLNGVLSYVSALRVVLLPRCSAPSEAVWEAIREPDYFPAGRSLFPEWPVWSLDRALWLAAATGVILFLPKLLAALRVLLARARSAAATAARCASSRASLTEILASAIFAPIRMVFHTRFLVLTALGRTVGWRSPTRSDDGTTLARRAPPPLARHGGRERLGPHRLLAQPRLLLVADADRRARWCSRVPLSVLASRVRFGDRLRAPRPAARARGDRAAAGARRAGREPAAAEAARAALPELQRDGFVRAVVDPTANALHRALRGVRRRLKPSIRDERQALLARALAEGPAALTPPRSACCSRTPS